MNNLKEFYRKKYNETFNLIYKTTMKQKEKSSINLESLENLLRDQYIYSDLDWLGRGEIKDITNRATVAALESILFEWKEELKNK
jgi:flagellar motor component MotA